MEKTDLPVPRKACVKTIWDPETEEILDRALTLWFPGPKSFTGEDCAEYQVHGGPAVITAVLRALSRQSDHRPAEAGEFTKRAFHADKLDLTQVEGLGDLISAETEFQRKQAMRQMGVASLEAFIDFSESEDIEPGVIDQVKTGVLDLIQEIRQHLRDARAGERLRNGVHVAIVGEPNVGKSTFMNYLSQREAAIVSPMAGTTRDVLETLLDIGGFPVVLMDTAGLRQDTKDLIEREGIDRAKQRASSCDMLIYMLEASSSLTTSEITDQLGHFGLAKVKKTIFVANKADLLPEKPSPSWPGVHLISCKSCSGVHDLMEVIKTEIGDLCRTELGGSALLTRERHRAHAEKALEFLEMYLDDQTEDLAIASHHLRMAIREIGQISGKVSSEQILDMIFADFCIGK
eukprot:TCALIF_04879-PA protein Name:"Similar to gtpbp3 tRNA modification GTPase GTPBP3, mitochondrial (Danio rerio)" AED:0.08 eAED:0.08 QI:0/0/0/0.66/1/1/3/0/403